MASASAVSLLFVLVGLVVGLLVAAYALVLWRSAEIGFFLIVLGLGILYAWREGALEWS